MWWPSTVDVVSSVLSLKEYLLFILKVQVIAAVSIHAVHVKYLTPPPLWKQLTESKWKRYQKRRLRFRWGRIEASSCSVDGSWLATLYNIWGDVVLFLVFIAGGGSAALFSGCQSGVRARRAGWLQTERRRSASCGKTHQVEGGRRRRCCCVCFLTLPSSDKEWGQVGFPVPGKYLPKPAQADLGG